MGSWNSIRWSDDLLDCVIFFYFFRENQTRLQDDGLSSAAKPSISSAGIILQPTMYSVVFMHVVENVIQLAFGFIFVFLYLYGVSKLWCCVCGK